MRVGSSSSSPSVRPSSATWRSSVPAGLREAARGAPASSRWSAGRERAHRDDDVAGADPSRGRAGRRPRPRRCRRRRRRTRRARAGRGARRSRRRPARSRPGAQPSAMPATIAAIRSGTTLPVGDVVGHEQRLGAADDEVVDDHADQVDADRVVDAHPLGDGDLGADAVGRGREQRPPVRLAGAEASNRPANPPRPPTTSGRVGLRDRAPSSARRRGRRRRCRRRRRRRTSARRTVHGRAVRAAAPCAPAAGHGRRTRAVGVRVGDRGLAGTERACSMSSRRCLPSSPARAARPGRRRRSRRGTARSFGIVVASISCPSEM